MEQVDDQQPFFICELCRERVDPADPDVVRAYEMREVRSFGAREMVQGLGTYFHRSHFPGGSSYRLDTERPDLG